MEHSNKPLTFEKLKEMVGEPVWSAKDEEWFLICKKDCEYLLYDKNGFCISLWDVFDYGLYAQPPAHIELESWKSEWERVCGSSECKNCGYDTKVESHFCPHCGKAMDEHALNIIKNQIGGYAEELERKEQG